MTRSDRLLIVGQTGQGKSVKASYEFGRARTQKIAIDVKREINLPGDDVHYFSDPRKSDWSVQTQVYRPRDPFDMDEYDDVYKQIFARRDLFIWLDECAGPTTAAATPKHLRLTLVQGRSRNLRHMAVTQRPVDIHMALRNETNHIVFFPRGFSAEDLPLMAKHMGLSTAELIALSNDEPGSGGVLDESHYGRYGHLHYDKHTNLVHRRHSLPKRYAQ